MKQFDVYINFILEKDIFVTLVAWPKFCHRYIKTQNIKHNKFK